MDVQAWARTLTHDVRSKWEDLRKQSSAFEAGYAVFYSPVKLKPELMIIGYNPGGGVADFDLEKSMEVPRTHDYLAGYRLAKKMRSLFDEIGKPDLLTSSVKMNLIFFRSASAAEWSQIAPGVREDAESFCFGKVTETIETLQPKRILAEGIKTYSHLRRLLSMSGQEESILSNGRSLVRTCSSSKVELIGIIHPTGSRISRDDWSLIQENVTRLVA